VKTAVPPYAYDQAPFGEFGAFLTVGERLVCHLCGRDYLNLQTHVWAIHGLRAAEYREQFRLFVSTPLWARPVSKRITESNYRRMARQADLMVTYSERAREVGIRRQTSGLRRPPPPISDLTRGLRARRSREWWSTKSQAERSAKGRFLAAAFARAIANDPEIAQRRSERLSTFWRGRKREPRYGEANNASKLSDAQASEIRLRLVSGEKGAEIARRYGVSRSLVSQIKLRRVRVS